MPLHLSSAIEWAVWMQKNSTNNLKTWGRMHRQVNQDKKLQRELKICLL